ncbi:para-nitrobenzyl esterase [Microbacterium halimionae]|uniref:Carboxylic ester hydrolase n=1 Tax=Microbacterium halimionae TaxID=1526413 RepID=A0A7W3JMX3_9MICO|nr:carboxylesterase family protein [Microbacterium halimionae]MBA8815704.1 para-nitrobenzyl esterase [Microbacterium halimionae]NII95750.1 para-nitrobenzyl esterase [Microbacterium halimionae]
MQSAVPDPLEVPVSVDAPAGPIVGRAVHGVNTFLGIPYAEAPYGERRFALPVPRADFTEPFYASAYGATPQRVPLFTTTTVPEPTIPGDDVLSINIFAPATGAAGSAPVLVWVHGGAFAGGSAASPWYDGSGFAREGVVLVSVSYRLAVEGFAPLDDVPTNLGLRDVILALQWIQKNIAAFGGDPGQVTLAGQSAGGGIALALMSSPATVGLMHRVVSISGGTFALERNTVMGSVSRIANFLGIPPTFEGFSARSDGDVQQAIVDLRIRENTPPLTLSPVVGDDLLPTDIATGLAQHNLHLPLLVGSALDEFDGGPTAEDPDRRQLSDAERAEARASGRRVSDFLFRSAVPRCAAARTNADGGTWSYSFEWPNPLLGGATHCTDLPFFFDALDAPGVVDALGESAPTELADVMHADLLAFVRGNESAWPQANGALGAASRVYGRVGSTFTTDILGVYDPVTPT